MAFVTPLPLPSVRHHNARPRHAPISVRRPPRRPACSSADAPPPPPPEPRSPKPVPQGVQLPEVHPLVLDAQTAWLETELRTWLDAEFRAAEAHAAHRAVVHRTARVYHRLRAEGVHDLTTLMLEMGGALEGADQFRDMFVGPWNIANKAGELLIDNLQATGPSDSDDPAAVADAAAALGDTAEEEQGLVAMPPTIRDDFDKYRFMQRVLDGTASGVRVNGAVGVVMGFSFDNETRTWSGEGVTDKYFSRFGDEPPEVFGNEDSTDWSETLKYLHLMLGLDKDEDGQLEEGLQTLLETLHGLEATKQKQSDEADHSFEKRAVVAKWLHVVGDFC